MKYKMTTGKKLILTFGQKSANQQKRFLFSHSTLSFLSRWIVLCFLTVLSYGCSKGSEDLKILFAGDLMLDRGARINIESNSIDYLFNDVKNLLNSSDVTIANFECVACDTSLKPINKKFTFRANREWLTSLHNNGVTYLNLANNHSLDFGEEGIKQTANYLKQYSIKSIGYYPDNNSKYLPTIIEMKGNRIAVFSSTFLKQNNNSVNNENAFALSDRIKIFKKTHPSFLIFVCLHWGIEMELKPTLLQIEQAHLIINAGADAIIGHHPHVVQTIEVFKNKYIFYSIGNFIFDNNSAPSNRGIFTDFSLSKGKIASVQIIPFNIVRSKPQLMNIVESVNFMNEISSISHTINFKQNYGNWKIL